MNSIKTTSKLVDHLHGLHPDLFADWLFDDKLVDAFEQYKKNISARYDIYVIDNKELQQDEIIVLNRLFRFRI